MSGHWEKWGGDGEPAEVPAGQLPGAPGGEEPPVTTVPDVPSPAVAGAPEVTATSRPILKRVIAAGVALTVVAVFGVVLSFNSRADSVKAAFSTVFSSPSLRVVFSARSTSPREQAVVGRYTVVLTMTSKSAGRSLSAAGGRQAYELSVLRGRVDLGDIVVEPNAAYARLNLRAIEPDAYASGIRALADLPPGADRNVVSGLVEDKWVGVSDSTVSSLEKSLDHKLPGSIAPAKLANLRGAFTLSFAQSWDAWTSIHRVSSVNGVTEYSVKLPVRHFVSAFLKDMRGTVEKDLPAQYLTVVSRELDAAPAAIDRIPAGLEIPMTLSVVNGSLTRLVILHKGDTIALSISHPTLGVSAPRSAVMVTGPMVRTLFGSYLGSAGSGLPLMPDLRPGAGSASSVTMPTTGAVTSGISGTTSGT